MDKVNDKRGLDLIKVQDCTVLAADVPIIGIKFISRALSYKNRYLQYLRQRNHSNFASIFFWTSLFGKSCLHTEYKRPGIYKASGRIIKILQVFRVRL